MKTPVNESVAEEQCPSVGNGAVHPVDVDAGAEGGGDLLLVYLDVPRAAGAAMVIG